MVYANLKKADPKINMTNFTHVYATNVNNGSDTRNKTRIQAVQLSLEGFKKVTLAEFIQTDAYKKIIDILI